MTNNEAMREEFEAKFSDLILELDVDGEGYYFHDVNMAWQGFQAAYKARTDNSLIEENRRLKELLVMAEEVLTRFDISVLTPISRNMYQDLMLALSAKGVV